MVISFLLSLRFLSSFFLMLQLMTFYAYDKLLANFFRSYSPVYNMHVLLNHNIRFTSFKVKSSMRSSFPPSLTYNETYSHSNKWNRRFNVNVTPSQPFKCPPPPLTSHLSYLQNSKYNWNKATGYTKLKLLLP